MSETAIYSIIMAFLLIFISRIQLWLVLKIFAANYSYKYALEAYKLKTPKMILNAIIAAISLSPLFITKPLVTITFFPTVLASIAAMIPASLTVMAIVTLGTLVHLKTKPVLKDLSWKKINLALEFQKLMTLCDEAKSPVFKKSVRLLWEDVLSLNKKRADAYSSIKSLKRLSRQNQRVIESYSVSRNIKKLQEAETRRVDIAQKIKAQEEVAAKIEDMLLHIETSFVEISTKIQLGQTAAITADMSKINSQVKTIDTMVDATLLLE